MLNKQLQAQIAQEATSSAANFHYYPGSEQFEDMESAYETGAFKYALKWQEAEQRAERYEKALKGIHDKVCQDLPQNQDVGAISAQRCIEIDEYITDLLTPKATTDDTANG